MKFILSFFCLFTLLNTYSQIDFNNYKTIRCSGQIPKDFSQLTADKVTEDLGNDRENLSHKEEKIFLQGIHYGIDGLLHSGLVIYGDPISEYVTDIADKLLKKHRDVRQKLRFYTIKSNTTNAFSTDQGIVFVTTGLISQLTNEAQLAFVLAHEISHYTEKHVVETFEYRSQNHQQDDQIRQLSTYSKDKEFEADSIGISLYHSAGYAKEELSPTFDVLMYSYLPFDEIEVPTTYFNNENLYVPEQYFPLKKYEIKAVEDYDDSESSHPNIKNRKKKVEASIKKLRNWGDEVYLLGEDRFKYIRQISRFESIRTSILDAQYVDALYSIFLLELEFPNSTYLKKMKAHCWLGMAQYKNDGSISAVVDRTSQLEGEIAALHFFIKKLKSEAVYTVALREITDVKNEMPESEEISEIYNRIVQLIARSNTFKLDHFSEKNFFEAQEAFNKANQKDSVETKEPAKNIKLSKYDRIKSKKQHNSPDSFDSTKFYYYAISDLVNDTIFIDYFNFIKDSLDKEKDQRSEFLGMSKSEKNDFLEAQNAKDSLNLKEFLLVEPVAISYHKGEINYPKSEELETKYIHAINNAANYFDYTIYNINSKELKNVGTAGFNERSILSNFLMQLTRESDINSFPIDYEDLREIQMNYGTSKAIFTIIEHTYAPRFSASALWFVFYPPGFIGYLPVPFMKGNKTEMNLIVIDVEKGKIDKAVSFFFNEPVFKKMLEARMYDVFKDLPSKKYY